MSSALLDLAEFACVRPRRVIDLSRLIEQWRTWVNCNRPCNQRVRVDATFESGTRTLQSRRCVAIVMGKVGLDGGGECVEIRSGRIGPHPLDR